LEALKCAGVISLEPGGSARPIVVNNYHATSTSNKEHPVVKTIESEETPKSPLEDNQSEVLAEKEENDEVVKANCLKIYMEVWIFWIVICIEIRRMSGT